MILGCWHCPAHTLPTVPYPGAVAEHGRHLVRAQEACSSVLDVCESCLGVTAVGLQGSNACGA